MSAGFLRQIPPTIPHLSPIGYRRATILSGFDISHIRSKKTLVLGHSSRKTFPSEAPRVPTKTPTATQTPMVSNMTESGASAKEEIKVENSTAAASTDEPRFGLEAQIKRNPHPDFKAVESSRQPLETIPFHFTQCGFPNWTAGSGANSTAGPTLSIPHREIDPYGPNRNPIDNYKLLISGIIPRPIGFISTLNNSTDPPTPNLAPFSYTAIVNHDPPIFCVGFSGGRGNAKDSCRNLLDTGECVINVISEWFAEAANYASVNAPPGVSEWTLSGLTPAPSTMVKPARVLESAFSIEGKLVTYHEWQSPASGKKTGVTCLIQGVNFWVREDAVNEAGSLIDPAVLRPVSRLGGISYGRTTQAWELPRPDWEKDAKKEYERLQEKEGKKEEVQN